MTNPCCATCLFWAPNPGDLSQGFCRRYPPTVECFPAPGGSLISHSSSPPVKRTGWCGEYQPGKLLGAGE
jgi:hypothetical protein